MIKMPTVNHPQANLACCMSRDRYVHYTAAMGAHVGSQTHVSASFFARRNAPITTTRHAVAFSASPRASISSDPNDLVKMQPSDTAPWIALLCSAEWLLHEVNNESFAEQLRERVRLYSERDLLLNFYLVPEPAWLDSLFPEQAARINRPAIALVCPDPDWMTFVQIRLDRVLRVELPVTMTVAEVTNSTAPVPHFADYQGWRAPYAPYTQGWWERFEYKQQTAH